VQLKRLTERLSQEYATEGVSKPSGSISVAVHGNFDLIIVSTQLTDMDGLRLAASFKSQEETRGVPVLMLVDEDDTRAMIKGLELGVNDYIIMPVDYNEMVARVKTQIRRKKYQDVLKSNYQQTISRSITDELTGLYNRHYLSAHLDNLVRQSLNNNKPLSLVMLDVDHFKQVNDTYGHDVGDQVLKQLADIVIKTIRSADLAARFGGEEFVVLMPETDAQQARDAAERIRKVIETTPMKITHEVGQLNKTVSIGVAFLNELGDSGQALLKRADEALYKAKHDGRNRIVSADAA
jgi:two-component system cell cycle response regulator